MDRGEAQIHIEASPEKVYSMVADVIRMGEWSPECYRCEWLDAATGPVVGARFRGYSKSNWLRWSRLVEVRAAEPSKEFAFTTVKNFINAASTDWRYTFQPSNGGTLLTESYTINHPPSIIIRVIARLARRPHDMTPHMKSTLARIKAAAERDTA